MLVQYAYQREVDIGTTLSQLVEQKSWKLRLDRLASNKGVTEDDLAHWLWVLEAHDMDTKVERFVSSDRPKPRFLLMAILRKDEEMIKQRSLVKLYDYIAWMCQKALVGSQIKAPHRSRKVTMQDYRDLSPKFFILLLDRLLHHCMMKFPSSIATVARLTVDFLQTIPGNHIPRKSDRRTGYANQCLVFNFALQRFSRISRAILANLPHNWEAQRILLDFSTHLQRPLVINKMSWRAIRIVLIGLKKSEAEENTARRYAKTWPPYIRQLDGLDETKTTEEYLGRAVRAGILQRHDGYADDVVDRAVDTLGGAVLGESITVQTRSRAPRLWSGNQRNLEIFTKWAARVKATRNPYEAWQSFNEPPLPNVRPNYQVYAEMFSKLYAQEVKPLVETLPGDSKEVFPPHLGNWTEFEREKLRPPTPEALYLMMLRDGSRPVRECLRVLLRFAPSVARAGTYLRDSPLDRKAVSHMIDAHKPVHGILAQIPLPIFDAYIGLLCRKQGNQRWPNKKSSSYAPSSTVHNIHDRLPRAIRLVFARLSCQRKAAQEPWHAIMRALSDQRVVVRPWVIQASDDMESLKQFLSVFKTYESTQVTHPFAFQCLCRCVLKVVRQAHANPITETEEQQVVTRAVEVMKRVFWELTAPVKDSSERLKDHLPALFHEFSSANVGIYIETLTQLEEFDEAARVMDWLLTTYWEDGVLEKARDSQHKQWWYLQRALIVFRAFCDGHLPEATMLQIEQRFEKLQAEGGTWEWPSDEHVRKYFQADG